jgi:hypothetical protein
MMKYAPFKDTDTTHTIAVRAGGYGESMWEAPPGRTVSINGDSRDATTITAGMGNYDGFIVGESGLFFYSYYYYYLF